MENNADIICLALDSPWNGVPSSKGSSKIARSLKDALFDASSKDFLVLCPQDCKVSVYRGVTAIGAVASSESNALHTFALGLSTFLFPGAFEEDRLKSPEDPSFPQTSIATALATGLAAVILHLRSICDPGGEMMALATKSKVVEMSYKFLSHDGRVVQIWRLLELLERTGRWCDRDEVEHLRLDALRDGAASVLSVLLKDLEP